MGENGEINFFDIIWNYRELNKIVQRIIIVYSTNINIYIYKNVNSS